jgi:hypothetical protein
MTSQILICDKKVKLKRAFIRLAVKTGEAAKTGGLADAIQEFLKSPKLRDFWRVERAVLC